MDLKALLKAHEQVAQKRKNVGTQACEQGYNFLLKAEQTGFKDKSLLKAASEAFIRAIKQERTQADAYIGLGYLLLLLSDFKTAEIQFKAALRYAPNNRDARSLLEFTLNKRSGKSILKTESGPERDHEQIFIQLVDTIQKLGKQLKQAMLPEPMLDPIELQKRLKAHSDFQSKYQSLEQEIEQLDVDLNTDSLKQLLRPLTESIRQQGKIIQTSLKFQKYGQDLLHLMETVKAAILGLNQIQSIESIQQFEQDTLEPILDQCDQIADQLDVLSEQGHDIRSLEQRYEALTQMIENLQDLIDGKHEQ
jgi:tetratricopeptide (TPR) repeat protein